MADFSLNEYLAETGVIILDMPLCDFDTFPQLGQAVVDFLSTTIVEKQNDADLHTWLIDFEGTRLLLKAEHYSGAVWLEALDVVASREVFDYLAAWLAR
jgi:hypothetical protein